MRKPSITCIRARATFGVCINHGLWIIFGRPRAFALREGFWRMGRLHPGIFRLPGVVIVTCVRVAS